MHCLWSRQQVECFGSDDVRSLSLKLVHFRRHNDNTYHLFIVCRGPVVRWHQFGEHLRRRDS